MSRTALLRTLLVASLGLATVAAAQAQTPRYHLVDLGWGVTPTHINARGEIAADLYPDAAAVWRHGRWHVLPQVADFAFPLAQNKLGEVAGTDYGTPVIWPKGGGEVTLETPEDAPFVWPNALAEDGTVVGTYLKDDHYRCVVWHGTFASPFGPWAQGDECQAAAIDRVGRVAGEANLEPGGPQHVFILADGVFHDLGTVPRRAQPMVHAMNDHGHVVGTAHDPHYRAPDTAFAWDGRRLLLLRDDLDGRFSEAWDINNLDQIVGWVQDRLRDVATLLDPTSRRWVPLESQVDALDGWQLQRAVGINDAGEIVGTGVTADGLPHGFLLVPVAE